MTNKTVQKHGNRAKTDLRVQEDERERNYSLTLYAPPSEWGDLLSRSEHYAYVLHDKDILDDGSPKEPHYHLLLIFKDAKTPSALLKRTNIPNLTENTTVMYERILSRQRAFLYLTHKTDDAKHKYQYSLDSVKCDDLNYWYNGRVDHTEENQQFIHDLQTLSNYELATRYGRDYIKNFNRYRDFVTQLELDDYHQSVNEKNKQLLESLSEYATETDVFDNPYYNPSHKEYLELISSYLSDIITCSILSSNSPSHRSEVTSTVSYEMAHLTRIITDKVMENLKNEKK